MEEESIEFIDSEHNARFFAALGRSKKAAAGDPHSQALLYCLTSYSEINNHACKFYDFEQDQLQDQKQIKNELTAAWITENFKPWIKVGLHLYSDYFPAVVTDIFSRSAGEWSNILGALTIRFVKPFKLQKKI